ncbi:MAG TPA: efflux RND transporter periplasmic adaptor subunit, partial [Deferrisomatales bacterium]|nr:efflux RND transporter periplasmic adaptor subunit [Deferrisomatales bacterium]
EVRTMVSGIVLARNAAPEQRFAKGEELYRIADLRKVWVLGDLFGADTQAAQAGLPATVTLPDQGRIFQGKVSQVEPVFDGETRTLKLRVEVDNPGEVLRPDMFVDVEIPIEVPSTLAVSVDAVLDSGLRKTVFVDLGDGHFEPRSVETGARFGDRVEIVRGLMEGEKIVVSANFLLDSESRMRAASLGIQGTPGRCVVCDMDIDVERSKAAGRTAEYQGLTYHFCSDACQLEFSAIPERHAGKGVPGAAGQPAEAKMAPESRGATAKPGGPMPMEKGSGALPMDHGEGHKGMKMAPQGEPQEGKMAPAGGGMDMPMDHKMGGG